MSSNITCLNCTLNDCFLFGFIESSIEKPADGLNGECIIHYSGRYSGYVMRTKLVNGMREGSALILNDGVPYLKLEYRNGELTGNVERFNEYVLIDLKGQLVSGIESGLFEEYDRDKRVVWRGYYRNGKRYSEVVRSKRLEGYYDEKRDENHVLLSIAEYDESLHDKNGHCMEYENGEWVGEWIYENGVRQMPIREYRNGILSLYDTNGKKTFESRLSKEEVKDGFYLHEQMEGMDGFCTELDSNGCIVSVAEYNETRMKKNGKCFELENGRVKRVCLYKMDEFIRVVMKFDDSTMTEFNENGQKVYEGGFSGDMKSGFVKEGQGMEFVESMTPCGNEMRTDDCGSMIRIGSWRNGKRDGMFYEVDSENRVKRKCLYVNDEMSRLVQEFKESLMVEFGENGQRLYEGGFTGDRLSGFRRNGIGKEFGEDGATVLYKGEWKDGKREGFGTELRGLVPLYSGSWKDGLRNGKGDEMNENGRVVFTGMWKNGRGKGKEMDEYGRVVYEGEWENGKRNGIGEELIENAVGPIGYWKDGMKNGLFYNRDVNKIIQLGCLYDNGEMKRVVQEFNDSTMIEYDENGRKVYEGEFSGDVKNGFVRCGFGKGFRMVEDNRFKSSIQNLFCCWVRNKGKGLNTSPYREVFVEGAWSNGVCYSFSMIPLSLTSSPLLVEELTIPKNSFNSQNVSVFKLSGLVRLKQVRIGDYCFENVRSCEMRELPEIESIYLIGRVFGKDDRDRNDGICRIVDCPKLISIQFGEHSFKDYHSFVLANLPSLQSLIMNSWCFYNAPSFSLTSFIDWLV